MTPNPSSEKIEALRLKWQTDDAVIRKEIQRLHDRGSGDFQSLMRQIKRYRQKAYRTIVLNIPQMVSFNAKMTLDPKIYELFYDRWSRGGGKTTILGREIREASTQLPRGVGQFIAPSYKMFLTRIIPSLIEGLEQNGLYQGLHYFVGQQPPRAWQMGGWQMPYQPPKEFNRFFCVFTGFGFHMISQDVAGDGRGLNTDIQFGDEDGMNDWELIQENNIPALRGSKGRIFEGKPFFKKKLHHSSMPMTETGSWVFTFEERNLVKPTITVIDADSSLNAHNLARGYLENAENTATSRVIYEAEYLNIRPPRVGVDSFYPLLSEKLHGYRAEESRFLEKEKYSDCRGDSDLVKAVPLTCGLDFGSAINSLVVTQYLKSISELRALKNMYVVSQDGKIMDDLADDFHSYYRTHQGSANTIYLYYDNTGNVETGNTRETRAEQFANRLRGRGWRVVLLTRGKKNPEYGRKFVIWEKILSERDPRLPKFRVNLLNCRELLISMGNAKLKTRSNDTIEKDKSSEARLLKKGERQYATDLSDAMDSITFSLFSESLHYGETLLPNMR